MPHRDSLPQRERPGIPTSHFIHSATDELALDCKRLEDMFVTPRAVHRQSYYSLYWVTEGKAAVSIDFVEHSLAPATFTLLQPGQVFHSRVLEPMRGLAMFFARDFLATGYAEALATVAGWAEQTHAHAIFLGTMQATVHTPCAVAPGASWQGQRPQCASAL